MRHQRQLVIFADIKSQSSVASRVFAWYVQHIQKLQDVSFERAILAVVHWGAWYDENTTQGDWYPILWSHLQKSECPMTNSADISTFVDARLVTGYRCRTYRGHRTVAHVPVERRPQLHGHESLNLVRSEYKAWNVSHTPHKCLQDIPKMNKRIIPPRQFHTIVPMTHKGAATEETRS
jgi:hypothetical protein